MKQFCCLSLSEYSSAMLDDGIALFEDGSEFWEDGNVLFEDGSALVDRAQMSP